MFKLKLFLFVINLICTKNVLANETVQVVEPDVSKIVESWLNEDEIATKCKLQMPILTH